jgi:hypothetical protein
MSVDLRHPQQHPHHLLKALHLTQFLLTLLLLRESSVSRLMPVFPCFATFSLEKVRAGRIHSSRSWKFHTDDLWFGTCTQDWVSEVVFTSPA